MPAFPRQRLARTDPVVLLCVVALGETFVVVEKPAGLPSVPGRPDHLKDSVQTRARKVFQAAEGPLICHRLDIETSGLMVLALHRESHRNLSRQFMDRRTRKTYTAVLSGVLPAREGVVDLPLLLDWPNRPRQKVDREQGRPARTTYRVIGRTAHTTRVTLWPETGRSHQLRVHASTPRHEGGLGAPILGDSLYGDARSSPRMLLHASQLAFLDPGSGQLLQFASPPPF